MPTEELEQALRAAKFGDAEKDAVDVIARMLEQPRPLVERILYAVGRAAAWTGPDDVVRAVLPRNGSNLSPELCQAIDKNVEEGMARAAARWAIHTDRDVLVKVKKLLDNRDYTNICNGCVQGLRCVSENFSNPAMCYETGPPVALHERSDASLFLEHIRNYRGERGFARVRPIRIRGNTVSVTCAHPAGTFTVQAMDLCL